MNNELKKEFQEIIEGLKEANEAEINKLKSEIDGNFMRLEVRAKEYYERLSRFEKGEPKKQAVECRNKEEALFLNNKQWIRDNLSERKTYPIFINPSQPHQYYSSAEDTERCDHQILQFHNYLKQEGLEKEWEEYILPIAKERYPKGTKISTKCGIKIVSSPLYVSMHCGIMDNGRLVILNSEVGKWAEKIQPLFTTENGVELYEGDGRVAVNKKGLYQKFFIR